MSITKQSSCIRKKYSYFIGAVLQYNCFQSFCLFDFFQLHVNRDRSSWVEPVLSYEKCVLLKDHNAVTPVRLEPAAPRYRVKRSTTEPLRSLFSESTIMLHLKRIGSYSNYFSYNIEDLVAQYMYLSPRL